MKQTVIIALLLLSVLSSCRRGCDVSPELTAMDSLFPKQSDLVMKTLANTDIESLSGNLADNRAFADMLYTQALFTLNAEISDSVVRIIDASVSHFRGTALEARALVFAGTARAERGDMPAAMRLYKQAEIAAQEAGDTFYAAYAQMQMGWTYQLLYTAYPEAISRYRKAIEGFTALDDKQRLMSCYECMGDCYATLKNDSAADCYKKSLAIALPLNDRKHLAQCYSGFTVHSFFNGKNDTITYRYAMRTLDYDSTRLTARAIAIVCAYRSGLPLPRNSDVSELMLSRTAGDSIMYYRIKSEQARARNDMMSHYKYIDSIAEVADLEVAEFSAKSVDVMRAEKKAEADNQDRIFSLSKRRYLVLLAAIIGGVCAVVFWFLRRLRREREMVANLRDQVTELEDKAENYQSMSEHVRSTLVHQRVVLTRISQTINENAASSPAHTARLLRTIIREYRPDEQFWDELKEYVEQNYSLILTDLKEKYPKLSEPYVRIICLTCVDCSPTEMMTLMGFSSTAVVANYKSAITRKIMRVDLPLNEIVDRYR